MPRHGHDDDAGDADGDADGDDDGDVTVMMMVAMSP